jgi:hypothetical protein
MTWYILYGQNTLEPTLHQCWSKDQFSSRGRASLDKVGSSLRLVGPSFEKTDQNFEIDEPTSQSTHHYWLGGITLLTAPWARV